ncbi:hypothetical protein [Occultella gossypii]|uniref:Uncharacterized protein n=1 Tax=Occultella gossypii TaxID=2800820 RepID=A0ABS7SCV9_9MICO|nr:hypothetical protein [Occultella gossypii]MBZ2198198.1 hypothetical protein [Occultella gossypii]
MAARWPSVVGALALLANVWGGTDAHVTAMIIILAAMVYVAAAALDSRPSAWVMVAVATVAVTIAMVTALDAIVVLLVMAAGFAVFGMLRGPRIRREVAIQTAGFVAFAAVALGAMMVGAVAAALLAATASLGHSAWDAVHHRRDRVVSRSLAEACMVLDIGLGLALLVTVAVTA